MKNSNKSIAGIKDDKIRSDCYVELSIKKSGGIKLQLKSKVESMYGESIRTLINDILETFEIKNAFILVEDYGALPYTLAARLETAIKRVLQIKVINSFGVTSLIIKGNRIVLNGLLNMVLKET